MLYSIFRHRMANACSGTALRYRLSLMPVHDWSEDCTSSVSSPVINRIRKSSGLLLCPTVARHHEEGTCRVPHDPYPIKGSQPLPDA